MKQRIEYVKEVFDNNGEMVGESSDLYNYPENIPFRVVNGKWFGVVRHVGDSRFVYNLDKYGEEAGLPIRIEEHFQYRLVLEPANFEEYISGTYRHYKGGIYHVIGLSKHTETEESLVVYKDEEGKIWCRPEEMFSNYLEYEGEQVKRFKKIK